MTKATTKTTTTGATTTDLHRSPLTVPSGMPHPALSCVTSVSGFRGLVGSSMDPATAMALAVSYAEALLPEPATVVLGRDSRPTGSLLAQAVAAGLAGCGHRVVDLGIVPTPTVPIMLQELGAAGGIQISASHNPVEWNALKCFNAAGRNIDQAQLQALLAAYQRAAPPWRDWAGIGAMAIDDSAAERHLARVLAAVDVEAIRAAGFTVVIDAVNGAGSVLAPRLLDALGCRVVPLYTDPQRLFPRDPEPTAANVTETGRVVAAVGAAIGFVQDPDADRLALIDQHGSYIGEEYTLALAAAARLAALADPQATVCTNLSTSRMVDDVAVRFGGRVRRTAVGEANVVDGMLADNAVLGGEGNGGVIDPRVVLCRDSHIGMALMLELLATQGTGLAELVAELPRYAMHKEKVALDRSGVAAAREAILAAPLAAGAAVDEQDGLKLAWPDRWLHLRASGTEPVSRIISEAPTASEASDLAAGLRDLLGVAVVTGH